MFPVRLLLRSEGRYIRLGFSQNQLFVNHIKNPFCKQRRMSYSLLLAICTSSWINSYDNLWQSRDKQQVQCDVQLWSSLHVSWQGRQRGKQTPIIKLHVSTVAPQSETFHLHQLHRCAARKIKSFLQIIGNGIIIPSAHASL